ncbi:MAG: CAP domain-containing protein [Cetobacterium sp.]|uniref:CAP domain-containing protein n=1 Tax=Cetobacterium sp. TaxID=2071632 RepID=UPI003F300C90
MRNKILILIVFMFINLLTFTQTSYEKTILTLVNKERIKHGISPLKLNKKLNKIALNKSNDMAKYNYFSHTSPNLGSPFDQMKKNKIHYIIAGENIAKGQNTPEYVFKMWMESKGHRKNILNPRFDEMGIGKDTFNKNIWTQVFVGQE